MKKGRKRIHHKRYIKFRERMLLIYIIGGIIPFIGIIMAANYQTSSMMLRASQASQEERVVLLAEELEHFIAVSEHVADKISQDTKLLQVMQTKYENQSELKRDYSKYSAIIDYQTDYAEDIADISIYVRNSTLYNVEPFALLGAEVTQSDWYRATVADPDGSYWGYREEAQGRHLQLSRILNDSTGKLSGILVLTIKDTQFIEKLEKQPIDICLLLNDKDIIYSNYVMKKSSSFILKHLQSQYRERNSEKIDKGVEEYLLSYQKIYPGTSGSYLTLMSIQDYREINGEINRIALNSCVVAGIACLGSILMIVLYSNSLEARLKKLRRQMHLVATGRYGAVEAVTGKDEIGEIYQELEKMMGDIQELTSNMVEEKVQKEKLHTHQKEVEFKMLASQINPHFLYNTLETIRMKARVNQQEEIEDLVKMLAKIMRRNIQVSSQMVSLRSEIELIENYLKIQNYRFGDRIESRIEVDPEVDLDMEVMLLIIQPFVENAFVHGLEAMSEKGELTVTVSQDEKDVIIRIIDNGVGMPYYKLGDLRHALNAGENDRTHIGINNVNQRMKLQYGEEYGIKIESWENAGTKVELRIPKSHNYSGKNV